MIGRFINNNLLNKLVFNIDFNGLVFINLFVCFVEFILTVHVENLLDVVSLFDVLCDIFYYGVSLLHHSPAPNILNFSYIENLFP